MTCLKYPYSFQELTDEEKKLSDIYGEYDTVKIKPGRYCSPRRIVKYGPELYNFQPRPDDIWLVGFPRSGTTLTQEILYLLGTDFNYEKAASKILDERFPYLEEILMRREKDDLLYEEFRKKNREPLTLEEWKLIPMYEQLAKTNEKRFIKSHMGFCFLHPQLLEVGCKVIFIARNIKDCIVSNYFYPLSFEVRLKEGIYGMWKIHKEGLSMMGNQMELLKEAWSRRHNKNLLILFYEDLNKDKRTNIKKISNFLGKKITDEELDKLIDHVDIKKFRQNKSVNNDHLVDSGQFIKNDQFSFIRQGKTGGWRELFSKEMNDEINEWFFKKIKEIPDFKIPECWKEAMEL